MSLLCLSSHWSNWRNTPLVNSEQWPTVLCKSTQWFSTTFPRVAIFKTGQAIQYWKSMCLKQLNLGSFCANLHTKLKSVSQMAIHTFYGTGVLPIVPMVPGDIGRAALRNLHQRKSPRWRNDTRQYLKQRIHPQVFDAWKKRNKQWSERKHERLCIEMLDVWRTTYIAFQFPGNFREHTSTALHLELESLKILTAPRTFPYI